MPLLHLALAFVQAPHCSHELYRAQMAAAQSQFRLDEQAVARSWLDRVAAEQRGFEWHALDAELDASLVSFASGDAYVYCLDGSPDGSLLACGLSDGSVELRSLDDGGTPRVLGKHESSLSYVRFDPSGDRLVTASFDRTVRVWDVHRGAQQSEFRGHGFPVGGAAFHPEGRWIASCSYERPPETVVGTVHIWDAENGTLVRTLHGGRKPLVGLEFSPDGTKIAAGSWDFCVFVWPTSGGEPIACPMPDEGVYNAVDCVAFSPDGKLVVGGSKDRTARVWNVDSGELVATLRGHTDSVVALAFSPDGSTLATASKDGTARIWRTADWQRIATMRGHGDGLTSVRYLSGGERLVTASTDRTMRIWDNNPLAYGALQAKADSATYVVRFDDRDDVLATASYDGRITLWSSATLGRLASWQAHPPESSCHALDFARGGRLLVSGSWEPVVRVWDAWQNTQIAEFPQDAGTYWLAVAPDGRRAATASGAAVEVYDLAALAHERALRGHGSTVLAVAFAPDGQRLASCGRDGLTIVWDIAAGNELFRIQGPGPDIADAAFSADGSELIVAGRGGSLRRHDAATGVERGTVGRSRHGMNHIAIHPSAPRIVAAAAALEVFDSSLGGLVGEIRAHETAPYALAFDRTGTRLASCSTDGTIAITDTRPWRLRREDGETRRSALARVEPLLAAEIAGGKSLADLCDRVEADVELSPADRAAWIELLIRRSADSAR